MRVFKGVIFFSLVVLQLFAPLKLLSTQEQHSVAHPFTVFTIPKAGSHLLIKTLYLMTGGVPKWHLSLPPNSVIPSPNEEFLYTHFGLLPHLEEEYSKFPKLKKILLVRDLRDVCLSIITHIKNGKPWRGISGETKELFLKLSFDDQLLFIINHDLGDYPTFNAAVIKIAEQVVRFCKDSRNLICRYENLVGVEGGGSKKAQIEEVKRIANYIGVKFTPQEIRKMAAKLYGDEYDPFGQEGFEGYKSTFAQGRIGDWKIYFKEEHKQIFKQKLGYFLIALGYEKDNNW